MRTRTAPTAFAVALAAIAPPLAAQAVRLPDSLAWTRLPSDPADFPAMVKAGSHVYSLYHGAGCPSEGGYAGAAYDALVEAADLPIRKEVAQNHGIMLELGHCPDDLPRFEALLAKWLREEWEAGLLDQAKIEETFQDALGVEMLGMQHLSHGTDPATYRLLRSIARDPEVYVEPGIFYEGFEPDLRRDAARTMLRRRINSGMSEAEAVKAVEADLAGAPPVRDWRPPGS